MKTYSGGMRRRLDLAASLVGRPQVLFLDEPSTGLDPQSRGEVWALIRELAANGVTVLLTTQYLEEADHLANEVMVIDHGRVVATGTPDELKARTGGQVLEVPPADPGQRGGGRDARPVTGAEPTAEPHAGRVSAAGGRRRPRCPTSCGGSTTPGIVARRVPLRTTSLDEVFLT